MAINSNLFETKVHQYTVSFRIQNEGTDQQILIIGAKKLNKEFEYHYNDDLVQTEFKFFKTCQKILKVVCNAKNFYLEQRKGTVNLSIMIQFQGDYEKLEFHLFQMTPVKPDGYSKIEVKLESQQNKENFQKLGNAAAQHQRASRRQQVLDKAQKQSDQKKAFIDQRVLENDKKIKENQKKIQQSNDNIEDIIKQNNLRKKQNQRLMKQKDNINTFVDSLKRLYLKTQQLIISLGQTILGILKTICKYGIPITMVAAGAACGVAAFGATSTLAMAGFATGGIGLIAGGGYLLYKAITN